MEKKFTDKEIKYLKYLGIGIVGLYLIGGSLKSLGDGLKSLNPFGKSEDKKNAEDEAKKLENDLKNSKFGDPLYFQVFLKNIYKFFADNNLSITPYQSNLARAIELFRDSYTKNWFLDDEPELALQGFKLLKSKFEVAKALELYSLEYSDDFSVQMIQQFDAESELRVYNRILDFIKGLPNY